MSYKVTFITDYEASTENGQFKAATPIDKGLVKFFPLKANFEICVSCVQNNSFNYQLSSNLIRFYPKSKWRIIEVIKNLAFIAVRVFKSDILICKMWQKRAFFACLIAIVLRKKFQVIIVGDPSVSAGLRRDLIKNDFLRTLASRVVYFITRTIIKQSTVATYVSENLRSKYGRSEKAVVACENWIEKSKINTYAQIVEKKNLTVISNFSNDRPLRILYAGRLIAEKGLFLLADALGLIDSKIHDMIELRLVGSGKDQDGLIKSFAELGIKCSFLGLVPSGSSALYNQYLWADVFVLPSFSEGMPLCLVEAGSFGCASIATRVGGIPELIEEGINGYLIEAGDAHSIALAIEKCLFSSHNLNRMAKTNYAKCCKLNFDEEQARTFSPWNMII